MTRIEHRGYWAEPIPDLRDNLLQGGIRTATHRIFWEAETVSGWVTAMREAVDDYIEGCRSRGEEPQPQETSLAGAA